MLPDVPLTAIETTPEKGRWFDTTHWSVVLTASQSPAPEAAAALEKLCRAYWQPLYDYVRRQGHDPHDAQDLTQEFFSRLLEKNWLARVDRDKGRFRSFMLASLKHFLANERDRANAAKRGGGHRLIPLDSETAEMVFSLEAESQESAEKLFERRWAVALLEQAMLALQQEYAQAGKAPLFEALKEFLAGEAGPGDYAPVAARLQTTPGAVAVAVHRLREKYREMVRGEIARTVAGPEEVADEMRHLFAALVS